MLTVTQIKEFKHLLLNAKRPLFFFDDDTDGLCSYLVLKKFIKRGKGVIVKSSPKLDKVYLKKVSEFKPDRIFVLDKPMISQTFVDDAKVQVVWLDHHPLQNVSGVHYFNPRQTDAKDNRPTSYWAYQIVKQNLWIAMCGIIGDWFLPPTLIKIFAKSYPGLVDQNIRDAGKILYETELGRIVRIFNFILKGPTSDVRRCISVLEKIESPYEILHQDSARGKFLFRYYEKINNKYQKLLNKGLENVSANNFVEFSYPMTKMSFSGDLANELMYRYPDKFILVGRVKRDNIVISLRSFKHVIPNMLKKALKGLDGYGGGHDHACGANISIKDYHVFVKRLKKMVK